MTNKEKAHLITSAGVTALALIIVLFAYDPRWLFFGGLGLVVGGSMLVIYMTIYDTMSEYLTRDPNDDGTTDQPVP